MQRKTPGKEIDVLADRVRRGEKLKIDELLTLMTALIDKRRLPPAR